MSRTSRERSSSSWAMNWCSGPGKAPVLTVATPSPRPAPQDPGCACSAGLARPPRPGRPAQHAGAACPPDSTARRRRGHHPAGVNAAAESRPSPARTGPTMPAMDSTAPRPFRLGCLDVQDGRVFAVDDSLPIVVEIDAATGGPVRVFSWLLSGDHRGRPTALGVLARDDSVLIASPAAGGIVEIDRRSGQATTIPLDGDAGALLAIGDAIWAVGWPDWDEPPAGRPDGKRPVVWEAPTDEETARHQEMMRRLHFHGAGPLGAKADGRTLAEWRDAEGDFEALMPPTPTWRVSAFWLRRIGDYLEQPILA